MGFVFLAGWNVVFEACVQRKVRTCRCASTTRFGRLRGVEKEDWKRDARVGVRRDEQNRPDGARCHQRDAWCHELERREEEKTRVRSCLECDIQTSLDSSPRIRRFKLQLVMEKIDGKGLISYLVECDEKLRAARKRKNSSARRSFS